MVCVPVQTEGSGRLVLYCRLLVFAAVNKLNLGRKGSATLDAAPHAKNPHPACLSSWHPVRVGF